MGKRAAAPAGRGRTQSRSRGRGRGRGRSGRRPTARLTLPALALITLSLGGGAALAHYNGGQDSGADGAVEAAAPTVATTTAIPVTPKATTPTPKPKQSSARPKASATPKKPKVPASGSGTFTTAQSSGDAVGTGGSLRRYRVQVEGGIDLSARQVAGEIQQILDHPRGWAAHGRGRFQLVTENADFVIRIATPATADRLCLAQGLNTRGELNCETTQGVVVNLKRWLLGSPTFAGTPAEYRHLIINHEVGHELGIRTHMSCPGAGKPAPVMMQQIKGLKGCRSNAYPYDEDGSYIEGPIVP
ncbi:DUF3152 domain-containing protein [Streptomyces sp. Je 1-79]|uniref:DUF3152 domain-containing protein n=1 Tax=Streptomyces sp. Je 1-79 TaxID=2943847 RepID=UPI0021A96E02|nr:DUF3152 domain-containing protein [Streptomyces sp. Je 1-79]MCT4354691.1 DUF3152 domain-containing protein [Streptomyces sp. Je 1-79]